jgi:hypothetical protein
MLNKPKFNISRLDLPVGFGLIFALLSLIIKPFNVAHAENTMANFSQKTAFEAPALIIDESSESKLLEPQVDTRKPDRNQKGVISFYSSTPDQTDSSPFIAADGYHVYDGMIANNCLPFGTQIKIPSLYGDKVFEVHDRMNSRYGCYKFDIWMDAPKAELRKLGIKRADLEIYFPEKKNAAIARNP